MRQSLTVAAACLVFLGLQAPLFSGEDGRAPRPQREDGGAQNDRREQFRRFADRRRAGEPLNEDDRAALERAREVAGRLAEDAGFAPRAARQPDVRPLLAELNVVDRAALSAALGLAFSGKWDEAQTRYNKVIKESPEKDAQGLARWGLGRIQQDRGEAEAARQTLESIVGRAAPLALATLAEPKLREGDSSALLAGYLALLQNQTTSLDRCRLLQAFVDLLEAAGNPQLTPEKRAELLTSAAAPIGYEQALGAQEDLAKEKPIFQPARANPLNNLFRAEGPIARGAGNFRGAGNNLNPDRRPAPPEPDF